MEANNTEDRIFQIAQEVFMRKGLDGTTMQDIANEAQISRTSLHYYYRNKETLFDMILTKSLDHILPKLNQTISKDIPLTDKIIEICLNYIDLMHEYPNLPGFMMLEVKRNPQRIVSFLSKKWANINFTALEKQKKDEIEAGVIRPFTVTQMVVLIGGLCAFPYACRPLLDNYFSSDEFDFEQFIDERREIIPIIIRNWLSIK